MLKQSSLIVETFTNTKGHEESSTTNATSTPKTVENDNDDDGTCTDSTEEN